MTCRLLLFEDPALEAEPRHEVAVGVGRNLLLGCNTVRTQTRSVVYIPVKIPWVRRLSQYLERQYFSKIYSHLVVPPPILHSVPGSLPLVWPLAPCAPHVLVANPICIAPR